ncbi:MAG: glutathione S-transferase N-terminal domain-containing protein [Candidatus Liptonbacteria bacterium]|nr:glutathione S-transferase N-terminal domain-containing protein [Candidatus Liptonbacteria bacterium]
MKKIKIYSTPSCVYCKKAKEFFRAQNIQYEEVNVAEDEAALREMMEKSHQMGVPVIDIEGEILVGYDQRRLMHALGISA